MNTLTRDVLREWLESEMSDISETHWAAGWMSGNEFALWDAIQNMPAETDYGGGPIDTGRLLKLLDVANELGEWYDGSEFVPLEEWRKRVAQLSEEKRTQQERMTANLKILKETYRVQPIDGCMNCAFADKFMSVLWVCGKFKPKTEYCEPNGICGMWEKKSCPPA